IFCAGADLKERAEMAAHEVGPFVSMDWAAIMELHSLPMPTIAALDGHALGGGLEMALSWTLGLLQTLIDVRISPKHLSSSLITLYKVGAKWSDSLSVSVFLEGTQRLPRLVGILKAKEMIFIGKMINGTEAEEIGLADYVAEQTEIGDAADQRALVLAEEILPRGPVAVKMAKLAINKGIQQWLQS
ncbi:methylglutaconyl-CoA hydratase, mitochondrial-like, partial [Stylophora pistillata]|uniref:methylglutaconyl-CoA hydratase, mitochondrial-like n=1 Tax=Stylophora pistillata TaxID=50429 RepID=UPI000C043392